MNFFGLLVLCVIQLTSSNKVKKLVNHEDLIGDPFEDCIVTRQPFSSRECRYRRYRSIDGTCNNIRRPLAGASFTPVARFLRARYAKSNGIPVGFPFFSKFSKIRARVEKGNTQPCKIILPFNSTKFRATISPSAQEVSDGIITVANENIQTKGMTSHLFMTFGQFIDHDLVIIENEPQSCQNPKCETLSDFHYPCFPIIRNTNPGREKVECNAFARSRAACNIRGHRREQVNQLTSYLDGSMIYGSTNQEARELRTEDGLLRTSEGDLLPFNPFNVRPCRGFSGCFLAGDIRVNENFALSAMHTIWVRLHNVIAKELKLVNRRWKPNQIFQESRQIVIAILQNIVYSEFLPLITSMPRYTRYSSRVVPTVRNSFATAAYRFGHSLVRNSFDQLNRNFDIARPAVPLRKAFNNISAILTNGIEETIFGLMGNDSQPVDTTFAQGLAEKLFIPPKQKGFQNLIALNIQRGRDHGLPGYVKFRRYCNVGKRGINNFDDLAPEIPQKSINAFKKVYKSVFDIELFPAGVAEIPVKGKLVGPTFGCLIRKQFQAARKGDRFFFERIFRGSKLREIKKMTMAKVFCLTLQGIVSIQNDVFKRYTRRTRRFVCNPRDKSKFIDLRIWKAYQMGIKMGKRLKRLLIMNYDK